MPIYKFSWCVELKLKILTFPSNLFLNLNNTKMPTLCITGKLDSQKTIVRTVKTFRRG